MARDMSDKDILKMELDQLKKESTNTVREPISKTAQEIVDWVEGHSADDGLIKGVPDEKNPYKDKGGCIIT